MKAARSVIQFPNPDNMTDKRRDPVWGRARSSRGQVQNGGNPDVYFEAAVAFLADYPVGSRLSDDDLDVWLENHGFLIIPPTNTPKDSNEWGGHLLKRKMERNALNKAAQHYRMFTEFDSETFMVEHIKGTHQYEVRALHIAVFVNEWQQRADRHTATIKRQMQRILQGVPWEAIAPHIRANLVRVYRELTYFQEDTAIRAQRMNALVQESYSEVEGVIGGVALRQLLEGPKDEDTEEDE